MIEVLPAVLTPSPILAFLSGGDMLLVLVIALLVFGPKKLPQLARSLGEGMREFKKASNDIMEELSAQQEPTARPRAQPTGSEPAVPFLDREPHAELSEPEPLLSAQLTSDSTCRAKDVDLIEPLGQS